MKEEDIPKLSNEEIQKIERITEAFKKREDARKNRLDAEANLESQKKWLTVFERAPKETIPFITELWQILISVRSTVLDR